MEEDLFAYNHHIGVLNAASVLMSRQLRSLVDASVNSFAQFFRDCVADSTAALVLDVVCTSGRFRLHLYEWSLLLPLCKSAF